MKICTRMTTLTTLTAFSLLLGATTVPTDVAAAPVDTPVKVKAKAKPKAKPAARPTEGEPDVRDLVATDFKCELGNQITVYHKEAEPGQIALRWKQKLHRLMRIETTTGANRFENPVQGLVWIDIPAKAMLLDSKAKHQLANECKSPEQMKTS